MDIKICTQHFARSCTRKARLRIQKCFGTAPDLENQHRNSNSFQKFSLSIFQQFLQQKMVNCFDLHKARIDGRFHSKFGNFVTKTYKTGLIYIGRIQINSGSALVSLWITIWIHHFRSLWIRIRIQGFGDQNCKILQLNKIHIFVSKITRCVSQSRHEVSKQIIDYPKCRLCLT
jgi:hypothetical protein